MQASVLTLTRAACEGMRDDGWLDWRPAWHSQMAEDLLLTLFTVAGGLDALSIGGPDGIIAVANKGLPVPTQQIIDGPWVAAHSVNHGYHGENEAELRDTFREARRGWMAPDPVTVRPRAGRAWREPPGPLRALVAPQPAAARRRRVSARGSAIGLLLFLILLSAMSWRRWGNPELDAGADLTVADLIAHDGYLPYEDVRYFYGPAGIYSLALAFKLFGSSFTVAFVFGYLQAGAILGVFYALARRWVEPLTAALATAVLAAIGFSGTLFNFVLPHTNSATFGLLFVLVELLALARGRPLLAGLAAGGAALTRPEFAIVAAVTLLAAALGRWREAGWRAGLREALVLCLPALVVAGAVLGGFALAVGADRLFFENLIPLDFTRVAGFRFQQNWAPFTIESLVATLARGALWIVPVLALVISLEGVRARRGVRRVRGPVAACGHRTRSSSPSTPSRASWGPSPARDRSWRTRSCDC